MSWAWVWRGSVGRQELAHVRAIWIHRDGQDHRDGGERTTAQPFGATRREIEGGEGDCCQQKAASGNIQTMR